MSPSAADETLLTGIPLDALHYSWENIYDMSRQLAERVAEHCRTTGERFDKIVVVPRGSYYPVNIVARELGFGALDLLHACITSYVSGSTQRQKFRLGQMPPGELIANQDLLVIEEVCDTGHTLKYLTDYLQAAGARLVRTGVLHYKPGRSQTDFVPDWFVSKTDQWIVYPWEINEQHGKASFVKRR